MVKPKIAVVAPAYNEEDKIGEVVRRIPKNHVDEIIVVDDCSSDDTPKEAQKNGATVLKKDKRGGVGSAIREGIHYCIKNSIDIIVIIAGDNQDYPEEIPIVTKPIIEQEYDLVQGSRRLHGIRAYNIPIFRRVTTKIYSLIFSLFTHKNITDATNGFRAFKSSIFKDKSININQNWLDTYELEPYLLYKTIILGYKVTEAPVTKTYWKSIGYTKMFPLLDWWRILKPLILLKLKLRK